MDTYKIYVDDRQYTKWSIYETTYFQPVDLPIIPVQEKLFSNDVFSVDTNGNVTIIHSSIRCGTPIPGVLILVGNKTYGRQKNTCKKTPKLIYKCIPDDVRLPPFLIPYEIKNIGFSKVFTNLYVTFSYSEWTDKHPYGVLNQTIGPVDVLDNFYEYQLYCKSLNSSIQKFQKDATKILQNNSNDAFIENIKNKFPNIEDRTDRTQWNIFTIDPPKSLDFDDGFSIKTVDGIQKLSIYIANVTVFLDCLGLWDSFSRRISTIYLPDKKRPMLPTILSDCLCSLQENTRRIAFVMDISIKDGDILDIQFSNCFIKVYKNYTYEEPSLLNDDNYKLLIDVTKQLSKDYKYISNIKTSHDVVCYLMILMNYHSAKVMIRHNSGIFRSTIIKRDFFVPDTVPEDVSKFIKIWNSSAGQYINGADLTEDKNIRHELLDMEAYIHITSPIRRLVDLLNMIKIQQKTGIIQLSEKSECFYQEWLKDIDYINTTMRAIRKVQCDCNLLDLCCNNPSIMEKEYDGYMFDKILRNDKLFQYIVYLPELKLSSRITLRDDITNFDSKKFKLFLFNDEENFKKKIRLHILNYSH
jgi:exoribonuclease R